MVRGGSGNQSSTTTVPDSDDITWSGDARWTETLEGTWIDYISYPNLSPSHSHN